MDAAEIRALTDEQIQEQLENARREVFNLRFRAATRQLSNTSETARARKGVARILTIIRQRQLATVDQEEE
jgi:large subunit ribosomal protein L29